MTALYSCLNKLIILESIVIGITLANKTTTGVTADIYLDGYDGTDTYIVKSATIHQNVFYLEVMSGNKIVLQNNGSAGDVIRVTCGTAQNLTALSVLEDV